MEHFLALRDEISEEFEQSSTEPRDITPRASRKHRSVSFRPMQFQ